MAREPITNSAGDRKKMNALKKKVQGLPVAERVAEEIKLARAAGFMVTTRELVSASGATSGTSRLSDERPPQVLENGGNLDLDVRANLGKALAASPLKGALKDFAVEEQIRNLDARGLEEFLTRYDGRLEFLAAARAAPELIAKVKEAVASTLFAKVRPSRDNGGFGGAKNS